MAYSVHEGYPQIQQKGNDAMYKDQDSMPLCGMEEKCNRARGISGCSSRENCGCDGAWTGTPVCNKRSWGLEGYPLASVYAPLQSFGELFDKEIALEKGTIFCELDLPFMGESVYKGGGCRG